MFGLYDYFFESEWSEIWDIIAASQPAPIDKNSKKQIKITARNFIETSMKLQPWSIFFSDRQSGKSLQAKGRNTSIMVLSMIDRALKTLEIYSPSTIEQAKTAWKKMALKHHPDVDKSIGAGERMREINLAYEFLCDWLPQADPLAGSELFDNATPKKPAASRKKKTSIDRTIL